MNLKSIRAIGFDMDYTLLHYRIDVWEERAYEHAKRKLLELGWPVGDLSFDSGDLEYRSSQLTEPESALARHLDDARRIVAEAEAEFGGEGESTVLAEELERLRWFPLPNAPFIKGLSATDGGEAYFAFTRPERSKS